MSEHGTTARQDDVLAATVEDALREERFEEAAAALERVLAHDRQGTATRLLQRFLLERLLSPDARSDRFLSAALDHRPVALLLIEMSIDEDKPELAMHWCSRLLRREPNDEDALALRSVAQVNLGDANGAIASCDRLVSLAPQNHQVYLHRSAVRVALAGAKNQKVPESHEAQLALEDLHEAVQLAPRRVDVYLHRARLLTDLGHLDQAAEDYAIAIRLEPSQPDAYLERGLLRVRRRLHLDARDDFAAVLRLDPANVIARIGKADALLALGDDGRAYAGYSRALALDDKNASAYLGRTVAAINLGHRAQARREFDEMSEKYATAVEDARRAVELGGDNPWTHFHFGRALRAVIAYDQAVAAFDHAVRLAQDNATLLVTFLTEQGETLRRWGVIMGDRPDRTKLVQALACLDRAAGLPANPGDLTCVHETRGASLLDMREHEEAIRAFEQAVLLDPHYAWAYVGKARALLKIGTYDQAVRLFGRMRSLSLDKELDGPWVVVGSLLAEQPSLLAEVQDAALPPLPGPANAREYLDRADVFDTFTAYGLAERDRVTAVGLAPESADAACALAWTYLRQSEAPSETRLQHTERALEAARRAERALELVRQTRNRTSYLRASCLDALGSALLRLGDFPKAVELLREAQGLHPHNLRTRMHVEEAQRAWQEDEQSSSAL